MSRVFRGSRHDTLTYHPPRYACVEEAVQSLVSDLRVFLGIVVFCVGCLGPPAFGQQPPSAARQAGRAGVQPSEDVTVGRDLEYARVRKEEHDRVFTPSTVLEIKETQFTLNGQPTFLLGISHYAALGASEDFIRRDLDDIERHGFNWLRVWATWDMFDHDVSAVGDDGALREPFLRKLK